MLNFVNFLILQFLLSDFWRMDWLFRTWCRLLWLLYKWNFLFIGFYFTWSSLTNLLHFSKFVFCFRCLK